MTVALEEFTEWRDSVEARLGKLEGASDRHAFSISEQGERLVAMDEDLSKIQVEFRAQRGLLQALHLTQNNHTARLMKLEIGQEELKLGQKELRLGQAKVLAGVQTLLDLLKSAEGGGS